MNVENVAKKPAAGDKFRPMHWSKITTGEIVGWGIERKRAGAPRYIPVGYKGEVHPFKTKAEAQAVCDRLNVGEAP